MFIKGDILLPFNRVAKKDWLNGLYHPAIVWDDNYDGNSDFNGIMITHSEPNNYFKNILMAVYHFEVGYEVKFSNSHFVDKVFVKFQNWGPFELVGKLTSDGISFIENNLSESSSRVDFVNYRKSVI